MVKIELSLPAYVLLNVSTRGHPALLIDGQSLVRAIGKSKDTVTFTLGNLANEYVQIVYIMGKKFYPIDITFDL